MTLEEAIDRLKIMVRMRELSGNHHELKALKLLIEAGKQILWLHESQVLHDDELLPGETKEG